MPQKDRHCSYCGRAFAQDQSWPRTCAGCGVISYQNPLPVGVCLLPVGGGLLVVRRGIPPALGELALPGGYIGLRETWQEAVARELFEETGIRTDPNGIEAFRVATTFDAGGLLLIFGQARECAEADLPPFTTTEETTERLILHEPAKLAFPSHTEVVAEFFVKRKKPRQTRRRK